jgi:hypothetical protein
MCFYSFYNNARLLRTQRCLCCCPKVCLRRGSCIDNSTRPSRVGLYPNQSRTFDPLYWVWFRNGYFCSTYSWLVRVFSQQSFGPKRLPRLRCAVPDLEQEEIVPPAGVGIDSAKRIFGNEPVLSIVRSRAFWRLLGQHALKGIVPGTNTVARTYFNTSFFFEKMFICIQKITTNGKNWNRLEGGSTQKTLWIKASFLFCFLSFYTTPLQI